MTKLMKKEEGQALVEFALVLPILLMLVCGIIDFGWLFYNELSLQNACREGTRFACVNSSDSDIDDNVLQKVKDMAPASLNGLNATTTFTDTTTPINGDVTVSVEATVYTLTPVGGMFFPDQEKKLTYSVTMKVES